MFTVHGTMYKSTKAQRYKHPKVDSSISSSPCEMQFAIFRLAGTLTVVAGEVGMTFGWCFYLLLKPLSFLGTGDLIHCWC